jgi:hypothetical protein
VDREPIRLQEVNMPIEPVASGRGALVVDQTRARQTERPATPFRQALANGVNVLMSGAEVATSVVAGPVLAAAVHGTRTDVVTSVSGAPTEGASAALPADAAAAAGGVGSDLASVQAMQRESQTFNLQLLALQEEVQQENRRFSTVSNVLRARHDTAKAAISNVRS